ASPVDPAVQQRHRVPGVDAATRRAVGHPGAALLHLQDAGVEPEDELAQLRRGWAVRSRAYRQDARERGGELAQVGDGRGGATGGYLDLREPQGQRVRDSRWLRAGARLALYHVDREARIGLDDLGDDQVDPAQ